MYNFIAVGLMLFIFAIELYYGIEHFGCKVDGWIAAAVRIF